MSKQGDEELAEQQALIPDGFTPSEGCIDDYEVLKPIGAMPVHALGALGRPHGGGTAAARRLDCFPPPPQAGASFPPSFAP